nr:hypothetical protein [uncultured Ruminococcus sp.]
MEFLREVYFLGQSCRNRSAEFARSSLSAGCTVQKIRTGAPTEWKQFRKIALEGSFTLSGVFQIAKEEVLAP